MARSIITLILPEYDDISNEFTSHDWKQNLIYDEDSLKSIVEEIKKFADFYKDEECSLMFDSKNIKASMFLPSERPKFYLDATRKLKLILNNVDYFKLGDWREYRISSETDEYTLYYSPCKDEIRTEIAARQETNPNDDYLIAVHITNYKAKIWKLSKDSKTYPIESLPMSIKEVFEWLATHRHPKREYHWNPKHGEFGKGAHKDNKGLTVSGLMGSREEAADIMPKAIGEHPYSTLHCYDNKYYKYMEYKQESTDEDKRVYHSFHIDDETRVSQRVKDKLALIN